MTTRRPGGEGLKSLPRVRRSIVRRMFLPPPWNDRNRSVLAGALLAVASLVGCDDGAPAEGRTTRTWACPAGWVASERGGCGPAVLLCASGGGAAAGACDRVDPAHPDPITLPDGGSVAGFRRLPDGGIGGAWPEPDDPMGPGISACPEAWTRRDDGTCDPGLRADCPDGSAALPGGACTATAAADCPGGVYPEPGPEGPGDPVVHVRAGAVSGAPDGSPQRPFTTIAEALARLGSRGHVLLGGGTYRERVRITRGDIELVGLCAAQVTIEGPGDAVPTNPTLAVAGANARVTLRGVTVRGTGAGIHVHLGATLRATGVVVADSTDVGVVAYERGTVLELTSSVVRRIASGPTGVRGRGLDAYGGATLRATGVVVDGATSSGVYVHGAGSTIELASVVVRGTRALASGDEGIGALALLGGALRARAVVIEDNLKAGVAANDPGTTVDIASSIVRGTSSNRATTLGHGLSAGRGAALRVRDVLVENNTEGGIVVAGPGTTADLASTVARDTRMSRPDVGGQGLLVRGGAAVQATGLVLAGNRQVGALVAEPGTTVELSRSVLRDSLADAEMRMGYGLLVMGGAALRASGVAFDGNVMLGVVARDPGTTLDLAGCAIRGTRTGRLGAFGRGLEAQGGAVVRADAVLIADVSEAAVWAGGGDGVLDARFSARDLWIVGVGPSAGGFGAGLFIHDATRFEGTRVAMQGVGGAAVIALPQEGRTARVAVADLFVRAVRPSTIQIGEENRIDLPSGPPVSYGLHAGAGCAIDVARAVLDTGDYGIFNASGAVSVREGVIARQRQALGAVDLGTAPDATTLVGVSSVDNLRDALERRDDLPTASSLAAPADPCDDGCL